MPNELNLDYHNELITANHIIESQHANYAVYPPGDILPFFSVFRREQETTDTSASEFVSANLIGIGETFIEAVNTAACCILNEAYSEAYEKGKNNVFEETAAEIDSLRSELSKAREELASVSQDVHGVLTDCSFSAYSAGYSAGYKKGNNIENTTNGTWTAGYEEGKADGYESGYVEATSNTRNAMIRAVENLVDHGSLSVDVTKLFERAKELGITL